MPPVPRANSKVPAREPLSNNPVVTPLLNFLQPPRQLFWWYRVVLVYWIGHRADFQIAMYARELDVQRSVLVPWMKRLFHSFRDLLCLTVHLRLQSV